MASYKWKRVPIYESLNVKKDARKIIKYVKVNRLSNHQLVTFLKSEVYKGVSVQYKQMEDLAVKRGLV